MPEEDESEPETESELEVEEDSETWEAVRLSGLPFSSEASRAAAGFQGFFCPSLCNDRCHGGTD